MKEILFWTLLAYDISFALISLTNVFLGMINTFASWLVLAVAFEYLGWIDAFLLEAASTLWWLILLPINQAFINNVAFTYAYLVTTPTNTVFTANQYTGLMLIVFSLSFPLNLSCGYGLHYFAKKTSIFKRIGFLRSGY